MCTLIVLHRCYRAAPLLIAANRDEYFERPTEGPALRETARANVVAPRDERAGGTWLGLNEYGLFAAITNRRCESPDPNRRSRGLIVMDALGARSAREAVEEIEGLQPDTYNPFNLLVADGETAHVITYLGAPERIDLEPGAHVIGNVHPLDRDFPKVARQREEVASVARGPAGHAMDALARVCASHAGEGPLEHTCVHAEPYGTCSSTLLRLGDAGARLHYAHGAPCSSEYRDYTSLLAGLDLGSPRSAGSHSMRKVS